MKLYELKACWVDYYDCPENGLVDVGNSVETIAYQFDSTEKLETIKAELDKDFIDGVWTEERLGELRALYPNYDTYYDKQYIIEEVNLQKFFSKIVFNQ